MEARPEDRAIEIGCGRCLISQQVASRVKCLVATDVNPLAVRLARESGLETVRADLFQGIKGRFDLIIFNPPYLPTPPEERVEGWINWALDGGLDGNDTIIRFLDQLNDHLHIRGRALLLVSSLNGPEKVKAIAQEKGLTVEVVCSKRYFFEQLIVLKLTLANQ